MVSVRRRVRPGSQLNSQKTIIKNKTRMALEIERKYLLSDLPIIPKSVETVEKKLSQFYNQRDGFRYRMESFFDKTEGRKKVTYYKTKKKELSPGVLDEDESIITGPEWVEGSQASDRFVQKRRTEFYITEGDTKVKWFIDSLYTGEILAEVELPSVDTEFTIPDYIQSCIVKEVTDDKAYTNRRLAVKLH